MPFELVITKQIDMGVYVRITLQILSFSYNWQDGEKNDNALKIDNGVETLKSKDGGY
ncbi:MAG: hypothetical protein K8R13_07800 [Methanococcoides sp.]|nr:hypothetical protein [Methanococcoides sp.]